MEYVYERKNNLISGSSRVYKMRKRLDLKKFTKNVMAVIMIVVLINVFFATVNGSKYTETKTITVNAGTTLWTIASRIVSENPKLNVQNVIIQIKELNNLESSTIYEGQELLVYKY